MEFKWHFLKKSGIILAFFWLFAGISSSIKINASFTSTIEKGLFGRLLVDSLNYAFKFGELSNSQKQAIITLIKKKGKDKRMIKNWRPISLINVDAKIAS